MGFVRPSSIAVSRSVPQCSLMTFRAGPKALRYRSMGFRSALLRLFLDVVLNLLRDELFNLVPRFRGWIVLTWPADQQDGGTGGRLCP